MFMVVPALLSGASVSSMFPSADAVDRQNPRRSNEENSLQKIQKMGLT